VKKGVLNELDHAGVGNSGFFLQVEGGAADDGGFKEGEFGRHVKTRSTNLDWVGNAVG